MASFDSCRFDFRLDDNKRLKPAYRRRNILSTRNASSHTSSVNTPINEQSVSESNHGNTAQKYQKCVDNVTVDRRNADEIGQSTRDGSGTFETGGDSKTLFCEQGVGSTVQTPGRATKQNSPFNSSECKYGEDVLIRDTSVLPVRDADSPTMETNFDGAESERLSYPLASRSSHASIKRQSTDHRSKVHNLDKIAANLKFSNSSVHRNAIEKSSSDGTKKCPPYPTMPNKTSSCIIPGLISAGTGINDTAKVIRESSDVKKELGEDGNIDVNGIGVKSENLNEHNTRGVLEAVDSDEIHGELDHRVIPTSRIYPILRSSPTPSPQSTYDKVSVKLGNTKPTSESRETVNDSHSESPTIATPLSTPLSPPIQKPVTRRQRRRKAHLAGSGQLTMCPYCSALFDNRKNLLSHQLTDIQCRLKQKSKDGHLPNSQYRLAVLRKLKRLTNNKVAQRMENQSFEVQDTSAGDQSISLDTMALLRDIVKQPVDSSPFHLTTPTPVSSSHYTPSTYTSPFNSVTTPFSPFATPLEPLPFPMAEQTTPTNLSTHKRTAVVAPILSLDLPIDLSFKRHDLRPQNNLDMYHTARMQLKPKFKSSSHLSLKEIASTKCTRCGMVVSRPSFMAAHMRRWHGEDEHTGMKCSAGESQPLASRPMQCVRCSFSCKNSDVFRDHMILEHP